MNWQASEERIRPTETLTTTAPQGASVEEIRAGVREAQHAREAAVTADEERQRQRQQQQQEKENENPTRPKSRFSFWWKKSTEQVDPYPGT